MDTAEGDATKTANKEPQAPVHRMFEPLFNVFYLLVWPFVSVLFGLVGGLMFSVGMTLLVFGITLVRTPMHFVKTMYVTAKKNDCFETCQYFDPLLRIVVFFLVPIPHMLWLIGITVFSITVGTLYYISKATKMIYLHEYTKTFKKVKSNVKLDKESHLGSYIEKCQEFMENDEDSYPIIVILKRICALVPGTALGVFPFVPFTIGVVLITIYRLPINFYKTMRIALSTVVLKWDLKVAAFFMLPFAHLLFPLVVVVTALIGSFHYFIFATTKSIAKSKNPFEKWSKFRTGLCDYYRAHQNFVGKDFCGRYDHPTGIPSGWQGESYGIPVQKILKWQLDFLVACLLLVIGFQVCLIGATVLFGIKLVPTIVLWHKKFCNHIAAQSTANILGFWAFYVVGYFLIPVGVPLIVVIAIISGAFTSISIPHTYLQKGCVEGLYAPFELLLYMDESYFGDIISDFRVFACLPDYVCLQRRPAEVPPGEYLENASSPQENRRNPAHDAHNDYEARRRFSESYWDRFAEQCILTTSNMIAKDWISLDDVQCMEPSVLQAIPAIAILDILMDTVQGPDGTLKNEDIFWKVDGTLYKGRDRPPLDNVTAFFWPKVMETKRLLSAKSNRKATVAEVSNVDVLAAMVCSQTDKAPDSLQTFVRTHNIFENGQLGATQNKHIRGKLIELSLGILQVKPFQDRMTSIFEYEYTELEAASGLVSTWPSMDAEATPDVEGFFSSEAKAGVSVSSSNSSEATA